MGKDRGNDRDRRDRDEELGDIFKDLGEDFSKLLNKLAEEGEAQFDVFSNIDDLKDLQGSGNFDFNSLKDIMDEFDLGGMPFEDFDDSAFKDSKGTKTERSSTGGSEPRSPHVDIFEEEDRIDVFVELPGISEDQISIQLQGDNIHLTAGEEPDRFEEDITLPTSQIKSMTKKLNNGILHLTLTRIEQ